MIYAILAIVFGIIIGFIVPMPAASALSMYYAVGIFAAMDSVLGALRAYLEEKYDLAIFVSGFIVNTIVAMILAYLGDRLGLPLYYAAIFVFGTRLFTNLSFVRRLAIDSYRRTKVLNAKGKVAINSEDAVEETMQSSIGVTLEQIVTKDNLYNGRENE